LIEPNDSTIQDNQSEWEEQLSVKQTYLVDKVTTFIRPKNINDSYRPTILEFKAFCRLKYPGEGSTTITLENAHKFIFYQSHSEKKKCLKG
jgi:hypothetical protein